MYLFYLNSKGFLKSKEISILCLQYIGSSTKIINHLKVNSYLLLDVNYDNQNQCKLCMIVPPPSSTQLIQCKTVYFYIYFTHICKSAEKF